ncbi:PadR family transcriptional regulator [Candidatus Pyrohabitans sp.]
MLREFFLGFIKIHILYHASRGEICGVEMMEELRRHGYAISPGTLYPTLHQLEEKGYLRSEERVERGKVRRYYHITGQGRRMLAEARGKIRELVEEVLE